MSNGHNLVIGYDQQTKKRKSSIGLSVILNLDNRKNGVIKVGNREVENWKGFGKNIN